MWNFFVNLILCLIIVLEYIVILVSIYKIMIVYDKKNGKYFFIEVIEKIFVSILKVF